MNQPIKTPPMPQMMVSQIGMLSRLPGAMNLPNKPMMMPARMTPMISIAFLLKGDGCVAAKRVPASAMIPLRPPLNHPKGGCITPLGRLRSCHGARGEDASQQCAGHDGAGRECAGRDCAGDDCVG